MEAKEKSAGGRPTICSVELINKICMRIMQGESVNSICKDDDMPCKATVCLWLSKAFDKEPDELHVLFLDKYNNARQVQAEFGADEMKDISDDGSNDWMIKRTRSGEVTVLLDHEHVMRSKLRIETRRWNAERLLAKKYGPNMKHEITGKDAAPLTVLVQPVDINKTKTDQEPTNDSTTVKL